MAEEKFDSQGNKESFSDKLGDSIEKLGDKFKEKGATKLGQKIHDLGDKIEKHHTQKPTPPQKPEVPITP